MMSYTTIRTLCRVAAAMIFIGAVAALLAGIWQNDFRWVATGVILLLPAIVAFMTGVTI